MLTPTETFEQQRAVRWLLPGLCWMAVVLLAGSGASLRGVLLWAGLLTVPALMLAEVCLWLSVFGTRATMTFTSLFALLFTLPLGVGPAVMLTQVGDVFIMGAFAVVHVLLLVTSALWHLARWRRVDAAGIDVVDGLLSRVHLRRHRIESMRPEGAVAGHAGGGGAWMGALSVLAYPVLSACLGESGFHLLLVCFGNAVAVWLNVFFLSRWWADAWHLRSIERRDGVLFVSDRLAWLEARRQQSAWGRFLRRCWPLPVGMDLSKAPSSEPLAGDLAVNLRRVRKKKR